MKPEKLPVIRIASGLFSLQMDGPHAKCSACNSFALYAVCAKCSVCNSVLDIVPIIVVTPEFCITQFLNAPPLSPQECIP